MCRVHQLIKQANNAGVEFSHRRDVGRNIVPAQNDVHVIGSQLTVYSPILTRSASRVKTSFPLQPNLASFPFAQEVTFPP